MTDETSAQPGAFDQTTIEILAPSELAFFPFRDLGSPDVGDARKIDDWATDWEAQAKDDADWAARALRRARARRRANLQAVEREKERLEEWLARENEAKYVADDVTWLEERLRHYHADQVSRNAKANTTVELPCGITLASQAGKLRVDVDDEVKLVEWLEAQGDTAAVEYADPKVKKHELVKRYAGKAAGDYEVGEKPLVDDDGEVLPGAKLVRGERTYTIRGAD